MGDDATTLFWILVVTVPVSLAIALYSRLRYPSAYKALGDRYRNMPWQAFVRYGLMFTVAALVFLFQSKHAFAAFFAAFAMFEFALALVQHRKARSTIRSRMPVEKIT